MTKDPDMPLDTSIDMATLQMQATAEPTTKLVFLPKYTVVKKARALPTKTAKLSPVVAV
jgi:hypothetical protein